MFGSEVFCFFLCSWLMPLPCITGVGKEKGSPCTGVCWVGRLFVMVESKYMGILEGLAMRVPNLRDAVVDHLLVFVSLPEQDPSGVGPCRNRVLHFYIHTGIRIDIMSGQKIVNDIFRKNPPCLSCEAKVGAPA